MNQTCLLRRLGISLTILLALSSASAQVGGPEEEPKIAPGDQLYINVEGKVARYTVGQDGTVDVPPFGPTRLADMKPTEAADMLAEMGKERKFRAQPEFRLERLRLDAEGRIVSDGEVSVVVGDQTFIKTVKMDGTLVVPNVGLVRVAGLTPEDAIRAIEETWRATQTFRVHVTFVNPFILHGLNWWLAVLGILIAAFTLIFVVANRVGPRVRRWIIATSVFLAGLFWATEFFYPTGTHGYPEGQNFLTPRIADTVSPMTNMMGGLLVGLGVYSLLRVHGGRVRKRGEHWPFSLVLLLCIPIMAVVVYMYRSPDNPYTAPQFFQDAHALLFENLFAQMEAAMFSMIAFFIMSAAYRAFRLRSIEASILMICALIVFLGLLPLGQYLTGFIPQGTLAGSLRLENVAQWLLTVINTPALRAVEFGIGVGLFAMSLRIWLNLERGALFD